MLAQEADETQIRSDLWSLRELRDGLATDYAAVDKLAQEFLRKYAGNPEAQGRIYLEVVLVHALSGLKHPKRAMEYAKKADALPLKPVDKAQLYLSWGDAIQFTQPGASGNVLRKIRREAAMKYLESMKVALDNNVPKIASQRPTINPALLIPEEIIAGEQNIEGLSIESVRKARQLTPSEREGLRTQYRQDLAEWTMAKEVRRRAEYSRDLTVKLYRTLPFDTKELKQLATEVLQDQESVDDLVSRVEVGIKDALERANWKLTEELPENLESMGTVEADSSVRVAEDVKEVAKAETESQLGTGPGKTSPSSGEIWLWSIGALVLALGLSVAIWALCRKRGH